jgi:hypothetical protein
MEISSKALSVGMNINETVNKRKGVMMRIAK